jgi:hypothetical protein
MVGEARTIAEVSADLFNEVRGYNELLAIEEAGAHIEYLYQRGLLEIANLEELVEREDAVAIRYRRINHGDTESTEKELLSKERGKQGDK